jgi:glycolate oxidase iron-sulfur subunit
VDKRTLEQYRRDISRCVLCGACKATCPSYLQEREESLSPRGRLALIRAVLDRRLPLSDLFKDRLAACAGCLACEASCPSGVSVADIIQAAKEQAVSESGRGIINSILSGVLRSDRALRSLAWLAPVVLRYTREPFDESGKRHVVPASHKPFLDTVPEVISSAAHKGAGKARGRAAFFVGCASNYFQQDIARAVVAVLGRLGFDLIMPKEQTCCGRPLLSLGDWEAAREHARHNAEVFVALGADVIVTACASCGLTFKKEYPKLLPPDIPRPAVLDIHELLSESLEGLDLAPVKTIVTYHDPCHLGRGQGLSKTVRKVLRSIPGLTLREMQNADRYCGFGGMMRITHHELSSGIAEAKARDIISTGVSVVATGCPGCRMQITNALRRTGSDAKVLHTVQIVEAAMRVGGAGEEGRETRDEKEEVACKR